jgi:hypothetical protein
MNLSVTAQLDEYSHRPIKQRRYVGTTISYIKHGVVRSRAFDLGEKPNLCASIIKKILIRLGKIKKQDELPQVVRIHVADIDVFKQRLRLKQEISPSTLTYSLSTSGSVKGNFLNGHSMFVTMQPYLPFNMEISRIYHYSVDMEVS